MDEAGVDEPGSSVCQDLRISYASPRVPQHIYDTNTRSRLLSRSRVQSHTCRTHHILIGHTTARFDISINSQTFYCRRICSTNLCLIFRLDFVRFACISTARNVRSLGVHPYDHRRSTNKQNTSKPLDIARNLRKTSYTTLHALTTT